MSKSATDTRKTETTTSNDDVIATAVQTQLAHISSFDRWLHQRTEVGEDRNGVVSRVQARLDRYKKWILEAEQIPDHMSDELESWSMAAHVSPSSGEGVEIVVTGPGSEESVSITTKDEKGVESLMSDKYLGYMIKVCEAFSQAQTTLLSLLKTAREMNREEAELSQPAEAIVQTHIRRLKEYNDMKDIGQQLIGLIAENRGVPVGTLYDGEFGVTAKD